MMKDQAPDSAKPKPEDPSQSLRSTLSRAEHEDEVIVRSNRRKSLLVVALFVVVLAALLIAYLQPA